MEESEQHLLADRKSFSILIREHHRPLTVYARALAEDGDAARDIVQEAFLTAYRKLDEFDLSQDFGAWMRGIVRFKWREWMRRQNRRAAITQRCAEAMDGTMDRWSAFQRDRQNGGVFEALENCITLLPAKLGDAVKHFYIDGRSSAEAAEELGASEASIRKRLERARQQLKDCLERKTEELTHVSRTRITTAS